MTIAPSRQPPSYKRGYARRACESAYPQLWRGLVGGWCPSLGNTGSRIFDTSGRARDGTLTDFTLANAWVQSPANGGGAGAIALNGATDYVSVPSSPDWNFGLDPFAVSWWEYRTSNSNGKAFLVRNETPDFAPFLLGYSAGGADLQIYMSSDNASWDIASGKSLGTVTLNAWNHFAVVRRGTNFYAYKNGVQTDTWASSLSLATSSNPLLVGRYSIFEFSGRFDDLLIYDGALVQSEISLLWSGGAGRGIAYTPSRRRRSFPATTVDIQFDAASNSGYQAAQSTYSWNHTWSGVNRGIAVDVSILSVPGTTVTSVTYNGVALSLVIGRSTVTAFGRVESWAATAQQLGDLAAGTYAIQVTLSASVASAGTAVSYTGVHQTSPTEAANSNQATNPGAALDASVAITSTTNNCWPHAALVTDDGSVTAGQNSRNNVTGALGSGANEDTGPVTPAGLQIMSYTGMGLVATWAMTGYAWRPVDITFPSYLLLLGVG